MPSVTATGDAIRDIQAGLQQLSAKAAEALRLAEPPPTPVDPWPGDINAVRIGEATFPLAAMNPTSVAFPGGRQPDELVIYRPPLTATQTNRWGAEAVVVGGRVYACRDRQNEAGTAGDAGTAIPELGFVLSGHGKARAWLLANAAQDSVVELGHVNWPIIEPVEPVDPPPKTEPGVLAPWVVGGYWQQYQGPRVASLPGEYNLALAAFAVGNGSARMTFSTPFQDKASFIAEVAAAKARGVVWCVSLGGGVKKEMATYLRNEAEVQQCYDTLVPIINEYGFQGIDYDLENGPAGFTGDALLSLAQKLKARYGKQFVISMCPRPYEAFYFDIAAKLHAAGCLDLLMFQFYDATETRDSNFLRAWIPRILDQAKAKGVPYNKMIVGAITYTKYNLGWNTIGVYQEIVASMRATRGIRGAFIWEMNMDAKEGWSFARQISRVGA